MSTNSIKPVDSRVGPTKTKSGNVARDNQSSLNSSSSSAKVERLCFKDSTETQTTPRPTTS